MDFMPDWTHSLNHGKVENQKLQKSRQNTTINEKKLSMERHACQKILSAVTPPSSSTESGDLCSFLDHHMNHYPHRYFGKCRPIPGSLHRSCVVIGNHSLCKSMHYWAFSGNLKTNTAATNLPPSPRKRRTHMLPLSVFQGGGPN